MNNSNEAPSRPLDPAQAAELLRVIDLEARWENLPKGESKAGMGLRDLQNKQKAFEAYSIKLSAYRLRNSARYAPDPLLNTPARLGAWCRKTRDLCLQAQAETQTACPVNLLEKAHRAASRIGTRLVTAYDRPSETPSTLAQAAEELDGIARWCDSLPLAGSRPIRASA